jgi:hypothetical protein
MRDDSMIEPERIPVERAIREGTQFVVAKTDSSGHTKFLAAVADLRRAIWVNLHAAKHYGDARFAGLSAKWLMENGDLLEDEHLDILGVQPKPRHDQFDKLYRNASRQKGL